MACSFDHTSNLAPAAALLAWLAASVLSLVAGSDLIADALTRGAPLLPACAIAACALIVAGADRAPGPSQPRRFHQRR